MKTLQLFMLILFSAFFLYSCSEDDSDFNSDQFIATSYHDQQRLINDSVLDLLLRIPFKKLL